MADEKFERGTEIFTNLQSPYIRGMVQILEELGLERGTIDKALTYDRARGLERELDTFANPYLVVILSLNEHVRRDSIGTETEIPADEFLQGDKVITREIFTIAQGDPKREWQQVSYEREGRRYIEVMYLDGKETRRAIFVEHAGYDIFELAATSWNTDQTKGTCSAINATARIEELKADPDLEGTINLLLYKGL